MRPIGVPIECGATFGPARVAQRKRGGGPLSPGESAGPFSSLLEKCAPSVGGQSTTFCAVMERRSCPGRDVYDLYAVDLRVERALGRPVST